MVKLCSGQCCNGSGAYFWMRNASLQLKAILELTWTWGTHAQLHTDSISNSGLNLALLPYDKVNHLNCFSFMKFKPMHVLNKYYTPSSFTISTINVSSYRILHLIYIYSIHWPNAFIQSDIQDSHELIVQCAGNSLLHHTIEFLLCESSQKSTTSIIRTWEKKKNKVVNDKIYRIIKWLIVQNARKKFCANASNLEPYRIIIYCTNRSETETRTRRIDKMSWRENANNNTIW